MAGCGASIGDSMGISSVSISPWKEDPLSLPTASIFSVRGGTRDHLPHPFWNSGWLWLAWSCAGKHSCCTFIHSTALPNAEDGISEHSPTPSGSYILFPPLPLCSLSTGDGGGFHQAVLFGEIMWLILGSAIQSPQGWTVLVARASPFSHLYFRCLAQSPTCMWTERWHRLCLKDEHSWLCWPDSAIASWVTV